MATDGERLHAGTLREVARQMGEAANDVRRGFAERTFFGSAGASLLRLAEMSEAAPPRLSDWIEACEGTGLGEPSEGMYDGNWGLFWGEDDDDVQVELHRESDAALRATVYNTPGSPGWVDCLTPAELRSALERLAQEAK